MRLFVSVDLPPSLCEALADLQVAFTDASGLKPTDAGQAHVTITFLGEVEERRRTTVEEALEAAVEAAGVAPFEATVEGLGVFPSPDYIRVVWVGVGAGAAELTRLHEAVESTYVDIGFDPEEHDFTPHVTLGRMEHAGGKELVQRLVRERDPTLGTMRVESVALTESDLAPDGPEYETLHRVPLD